MLAVLARENGVPFYVAAPTSTIDPALPDGDGIEIGTARRRGGNPLRRGHDGAGGCQGGESCL